MPAIDKAPTRAEAATADFAGTKAMVQATLRFNTLVFGVILGLFFGASLWLLALVAGNRGFGGLAVALIGVFLPGYGADWYGALIGLVWGFVLGAALGGLIYRINTLRTMSQLDRLVIERQDDAEIDRAVLRLHGPSLGLAIGTAGALGLVVTTNMLVARGTAGESWRARLLAEVLPGYAVNPIGSVIGAIELFVILYASCQLFAAVYNRMADRRRR